MLPADHTIRLPATHPPTYPPTHHPPPSSLVCGACRGDAQGSSTSAHGTLSLSIFLNPVVPPLPHPPSPPLPHPPPPTSTGLVRAEEMHKVQHKAAVRLERLQHQRTWNIINLEHQQAAHLGAAATNEGKTPLAPAAAAAAGATGEGNASDAAAAVLDGTQSVTAATAGGARGGGLQQRRRQQQQEPGAVSVGAAGEGAVGLSQQHQPGVLLGDMHQVSYSLQQRANRPK
jgi:hypothetical protein